jgi:hypothetical protein
MKKLIMILVMMIATSAMAASVSLTGYDAQRDYAPSDIILFQLTSDAPVGTLQITEITTDNGGTAQNPHLGAAIADGFVQDPGTLVNEGGVLIKGVAGDGGSGMLEVAPGDPFYSFEFHVPEVPASTYITIEFPKTNNITDKYYGQVRTSVPSVTIHVIPEPMTIALLGLGGLFLRRRK